MLISHILDRHTCNLIMSCIFFVSSSVIVDGHPSDFFQLSRGIRKGDPLSLYIFILCMKHLTHMINESVASSGWTLFSFHRNRVHISQLFFADDILLFGETNVSTADVIYTIDLRSLPHKVRPKNESP